MAPVRERVCVSLSVPTELPVLLPSHGWQCSDLRVAAQLAALKAASVVVAVWVHM